VRSDYDGRSSPHPSTHSHWKLIWKETSLVGYIWEFAALHGGLATFKFLTSIAQVWTDGHTRAGQRAVLGYRMAAVVLRNGSDSEDCALELLDF
jgi:hypothetical protein